MLNELWKCDEKKMDPNQLKIKDCYLKIRRNKLSLTWQQNMFVGESLNWRERNLIVDEFKNIVF